MTLVEKWEYEYANHGIPSSIRTTPSHSLLKFLDFIKGSCHGKKLLDIGCGKGRNAFYAAKQGLQVTAIDFIEHNIAHIKNNSEPYATSIDALCMDITRPWQFDDNYFDYAYDAFCFKHIIELNNRKSYIAELARVLKSEQYFSISLADVSDGYYGQFITQGCSEQNLIIDPQNQIPSILYSYDSFLLLFGDFFNVVSHQLKHSISDMYGKAYHRSIHEFILQKNNFYLWR